jgi:hypothetical protein
MSNTSKRWLLITIISISAIVAISFAVFTKKQAAVLESNASPDIESAVYSGTNDNKNSMVLREIVRDGDWAAAVAISIKASDYGNNSTIILKKDGEGYKVVYRGTSDDEEYLKNDFGVPQKIIQAAFHDSRINEYVESIVDSAESPHVRHPVIKHLPVEEGTYSIQYGYDNEYDVESFYLYINATDGYRNAAIGKIYGLGFDPANYRIKFKNHTNPFEEASGAK